MRPLDAKKRTYGLLVVVFIAWGILIYRFVSDLNADVVLPTQMLSAKVNFKNSTKPKQTFELLTLTTDPFLGKAKSTSKKSAQKSSVSNAAPWPQIKYLGIVADKKGKASVFIIEIDGVQYLLNRLEEAKDVKVISGSLTKVSLRFNGQVKQFSN